MTRFEMGDRSPALRVQLNRESETLSDVARHAWLLEDVWRASAGLALYRAGELAPYRVLPTLDHIRLRKQSPLVVDIDLTTVLVGAATPYAASLLRYFLMNPRRLGSFIPEVLVGWRRGWDRADRVQRDTELARLVNLPPANIVPPVQHTGDPLNDVARFMQALQTELEDADPRVSKSVGIEDVEDPSNGP